jgi:hypothetical protein
LGAVGALGAAVTTVAPGNGLGTACVVAQPAASTAPAIIIKSRIKSRILCIIGTFEAEVQSCQ